MRLMKFAGVIVLLAFLTQTSCKIHARGHVKPAPRPVVVHKPAPAPVPVVKPVPAKPPAHAPAHGVRKKVTYAYLYYPDAQVYFCSQRRVYFYLSGGTWRSAARLPGGLTLGTSVNLSLDVDKPHIHHASHKVKYPPGQLKKAVAPKKAPPGQLKPGPAPKKAPPGKSKGKGKKK